MESGKKFLDNPAICAFFSHPSAFTPLQFADGDGFDQQMVFYIKPGYVPVGGDNGAGIDLLLERSNHPSCGLSHFGYKNPQLSYKCQMASVDLCCLINLKI